LQPQSISPLRAQDGSHEVKHDGYRTILIVERRKARAYTRNGFDWSENYLGITNAAAKLDCRSAIIDGEVIVQNEHNRVALPSEPLLHSASDLLA
jgi:ATP-dependent DNA ligase